ncbi:MAG: hypothetical protein IKS37_09095 [Solobacterium sp.]|nr:hypothetical protein [Solobacterium sp.]
MKRTKMLFSLIILSLLFVSGCKGFKYVFTGGLDDYSIEVNASDGDYAESSDFTLLSDRNAVITGNLEEGKLQIEFAEATIIMTDPDTPEDVIVGNVIETVTVGGNEELTVRLPQNDYVMLVTAMGKTKGKIDIKFVKP